MLSIPLSALLAPDASARDSDADPAPRRRKAAPSPTPAPTTTFPPLAAVLGPLPPSAALNIARWAVNTSSLPAFESALPDRSLSNSTPTRALLITGPRASIHASLEDEDEPHLRALDAADAKVDVRYCPSPGHARLLLTLLTTEAEAQAQQQQQQVYTVPPPAVLVLYDLLALFEENDENAPGAAFGTTPASAYLDLVSAARAAAKHLNCTLIVLEPRAPDSLPILATNVPPQARERRVPLHEGMRWLLGCVVRSRKLEREDDNGDGGMKEGGEEVYEITIDESMATAGGTPKAYVAHRRVPSSEFAAPSEGGHEWVWVDAP